MGGYMGTFTVVLMAALVATVAGQGGGSMPSCATKLTGCASYLNATTKPPQTCCGPLQDAVEHQKTCLCNLYNTPGLLQGLGVNITQAMNLPILCGFSTPSQNANFCKASAMPPSSGSSSTPTPSGGSGSGSGSNAAITVSATTGLLSSLLMFVVYTLLY